MQEQTITMIDTIDYAYNTSIRNAMLNWLRSIINKVEVESYKCLVWAYMWHCHVSHLSMSHADLWHVCHMLVCDKYLSHDSFMSHVCNLIDTWWTHEPCDHVRYHWVVSLHHSACWSHQWNDAVPGVPACDHPLPARTMLLMVLISRTGEISLDKDWNELFSAPSRPIQSCPFSCCTLCYWRKYFLNVWNASCNSVKNSCDSVILLQI